MRPSDGIVGSGGSPPERARPRLPPQVVEATFPRLLMGDREDEGTTIADSRPRAMDLATDKPLAPATGAPEPAGPAAGAEECVETLRRCLKVETERLRTRHRLGLGGREIATARCDLVDLVVVRACRLAASNVAPTLPADQERIAVVALGGYGRRELAPGSDVDLLFLHADRSDEDTQAVVEQALALLWDAGLTVGHSFRTVGQCVAMARADLHSRTALTEARLLTGSERLFARLMEQMDALVFTSARVTEAFLEALRSDLGERYARFGSQVGLQEPHVKESAGGLRDLHAVLWVAHARFGTRGLAALLGCGGISDREHRAALRAYDHLWRVRNEAHFATGRKTDLLTLDLQPALAEKLGYRPRGGLLASEIFMREYYRRASELHRFASGFLLRQAPAPSRRRFAFGLRRRRPRGTFEIRDGKLHSRDSGGIGGPRRLLEAFAVAQAEGVELGEELKVEVRGGLPLVDRAFRESPEAGRALVRLFGRAGRVGSTLRVMHETGLLDRLLPEFARVTFLVQHDFYHRYTVDEHTLAAIDALDRVAASADPVLARFRKVLDEVERAASLYLGLFLHDIGKGHGGGHVRRGTRIAERVCARLGVDPRTAADVSFLVEAHLDMSQISQRRDLTEPGLIEAFARRVSTADRLNMLLLLTYADHCGVGPGIWTEWKGALLWDLYTRTRACLHEGAGPAGDRHRAGARERAIRELEGEFRASEVERHFALMPERYMRATDAADMVGHFRLLQRLGGDALAAEWRPHDHCTELVVAAPDHPGLFARLAGTMTAQSLDILSVDLYTREDGVALDVFKVRDAGDHAPVPAERWPAVERALRAAVEGRYDVAAAVERWRAGARRRPKRPLAPPAVRFDSLSSQTSSVVEVRAEDEPGLVFRITSALSAYGLDINFAKVATEKSHALDVFYVTDAEGGKLDAEDMPRLEAALLVALDPRRVGALTKEDG
ncbi:MAG: [protein-PII] uridylyltransferase [Acidobacteria bacterium]|nr:MAG: [protein-PII] uridylyltransferase [Acidobacteriota bacterium]